MYGYIYITTNNITGVKYIGQHKSTEWDPNYIGSGTVLIQAIKKRALSNTGKKHPTAGEKISKSLKGKSLSEEHKESLRKPKTNKPRSMYPMMKDDKMIRVYAEDVAKYEADGWKRKSKSHSEAASEKHSQAVKGKIYVFKSPKIKVRIDPEDLDSYIAKGYKRHLKDFNCN